MFYPLDFTFVCPTEILAFNKHLEDFRRLGCEVLCVSVDSEYCHLAWTTVSPAEGGVGRIGLPLVSDSTHRISEQYGVLIPEQGVAYRGLFLLDPEQTVKQITVNDLPIGRSVDEALRLLRAHQHHALHGEVCPAGWNTGMKAVTPTTQGIKDYLKTL